MVHTPIPPYEDQRIDALRELDVLDSAPEAEFDALVQAAALVCSTPISLISLIDLERQWIKANVGLPTLSETPREVAFCAHAIMQDGILEITDLTADPRFADNPSFALDPSIRFYAGATLKLSNGMHVGALCVIDSKPRRLDDAQRLILSHLAKVAVDLLEGRRARQSEHRLREEFISATRELAASEERFRTLSEASPLGVFATDRNGLCQYTNGSWQTIYGLNLEQSLGHGWSSTLHPEDREAVFSEWQRSAEAGDDFDMEFRIKRPECTIRFVRARSRPSRDKDGQIICHIGSVEDVTDARAARDQLVAEQSRLASIIDGTGVGTWEWNVQTGETRFNERWAEIVGWSLAELGKTSIQIWIDLAHPDDLQVSGELLERHFAGETALYNCEARMRHRNGHWIWVLDRGRVFTRTPDGKPEWMFGTHFDITERKRRDELLRKSEALLNRTGEVAGVGGWELDIEASTLMWTAQTRVIHGVSADYQPTLTKAITFYAPEARPVIASAVERAMTIGEGWDLELPFIRAEGKRIWVRAVGNVELADGKPVRLWGAFQDITERRALCAELADQHELLRVTFRSIGDAVITTDALGRVTWLNLVAERMTGWPSAEAKGKPVSEVLHIVNGDTREPWVDLVAICLQRDTGVGRADASVLVSRGGDEYGIEMSVSPIRNEAEERLGVVLVFRDVTEERRLSNEMAYRARHDALTGLLNRAEFEARLQRLLNETREDRGTHALIYLDLDQFKLINDVCGHSVGDEVLQKVAKLLGDCIGQDDTLARLGGDEFGVILNSCAINNAQRVAETICVRMNDFRFFDKERRLRVGASIGLVPIDTRWATAEAIMQAADISCYAAKDAGRNRVHMWFDTDEAMRMRHGEMQWASRIEQALDEELFVLHAQRIFPLAQNDNGLRAEVLLRLRADDGSLIMPSAFLPAAERYNLASRIDAWVLKEAIATLKGSGRLANVASIGINLSGQSIGDRTFHGRAMNILIDAGPAICRMLWLEITETAAVTNIADAAVFIEQAQELGVRIALDDFGAGVSSFGYLKRLPVNVIKIDGQFIRNFVNDPLDKAAVQCFVDVAQVIGVQTVAEFVDREEVLDGVRGIGVDFAQGFHLHKPEPLAVVLSRAGSSMAT
ncbi:MAG: PAS domain S-box protein [Phreatobacter sp.]|nr:PAS domain S-box protein [Phreatobacter sp.]